MEIAAKLNRLGTPLSHRSTAFIIVGLGLVIRLMFLALIAHQPLMSDAASYNQMASELLRGTPFVPYWPPGVPLYVAAVRYALGDTTLLVRLAMLVFYIGCSNFLYRTALLLNSKAVGGNLALLLLAVSPATILASLEPVTELPAAMSVMVIAYCLLRAETPRRFRNLVLLGSAIGFLALVRPSSLIMLALVPLYLLWRTRKLAGAGTVLLVGVLIIGAWIGYVQQKTGRFIKINTANGKNLFYGNNPDTPLYRTWWWGSHHERESAYVTNVESLTPDPVAQEAEFSRMARQYIQQHPGLFLIRSFNRVCTYFAFNSFAGAFLMGNYGFSRAGGLALLGMDASLYVLIFAGSILYASTISGKGQRTLNMSILLGLALAYALPYFFAISHPRYHYPIEPMLMALSATFLAGLMNYDIPWETIKRRKALLTTALVVFGAIQVEFFIMMADRI